MRGSGEVAGERERWREEEEEEEEEEEGSELSG